MENNFKGHIATLTTVAIVVGSIVTILSGWSFYKNNFYKPNNDLKVISVDYDKGVAKIQFKQDIINLVGDATWSLTGQWGVRFGVLSDEKGSNYNSLEITQNGMVYDYLDTKKV